MRSAQVRLPSGKWVAAHHLHTFSHTPFERREMPMSLEDLRPHAKISIVKPSDTHEQVFGPGIARLCKGVMETGSLNAAAKQMHMAYSKAWRIIKDTENSLGIQLLIRDGAHGSYLTEDAKILLATYDKLVAHIRKESDAAYEKFLAECRKATGKNAE